MRGKHSWFEKTALPFKLKNLRTILKRADDSFKTASAERNHLANNDKSVQFKLEAEIPRKMKTYNCVLISQAKKVWDKEVHYRPTTVLVDETNAEETLKSYGISIKGN